MKCFKACINLLSTGTSLEALNLAATAVEVADNVAHVFFRSGNFHLEDATGSVYVYGLLSGWGGPKKMFQELGLKNGDKVTIVGVKSSYKGSPQVGSAFFVSKAE